MRVGLGRSTLLTWRGDNQGESGFPSLVKEGWLRPAIRKMRSFLNRPQTWWLVQATDNRLLNQPPRPLPSEDAFGDILVYGRVHPSFTKEGNLLSPWLCPLYNVSNAQPTTTLFLEEKL